MGRTAPQTCFLALYIGIGRHVRVAISIHPAVGMRYCPDVRDVEPSLPSPPSDGTPGSPHAISLSTLTLRSLENPTPPYTPRSRRRWVAGISTLVTRRHCWSMCSFLSLPVHTESFFPLARVARLLPPLPPSSIPPLNLLSFYAMCVCVSAEAWNTHWPCCQTPWRWRRKWSTRPRTGGTQSHRSFSPRSAQRRWTGRPSYTVQSRKCNKKTSRLWRSFPDDVLLSFSSIFRAVHHWGVPPAHTEGPGPGLLPEDEIGAQRCRAGLHLSQPASSLRTPRSDHIYSSLWFEDSLMFISLLIAPETGTTLGECVTLAQLHC